MSTAKLQDPVFRIPYLDKYIHIFLFGMHAWLLGNWWSDRKTENKRYTILAMLISVFYGIAMEYYQEAFTSRAFEFADILADAAGASLGMLLIGIEKKRPLWK